MARSSAARAASSPPSARSVNPSSQRRASAICPSAPSSDRAEAARHTRALDIEIGPLGDDEVAAIVAFLHALTGETAEPRPLGRPETVPSGLTVD